MCNLAVKRVISLIVIIVFLLSQVTVVKGISSSVYYSSAGQYVSTGKTNCYPDKGQWSEESLKKFYIEYNSKSGDEIKPVDKNSDFTYCWLMPLEGMKEQIDDGLKYNIQLDVFGQLVDGDTANIYIDFWVPFGDNAFGFETDQYLQEDAELWSHKSFQGYVPENATHMRLRLTGIKAKDLIADKDCAIYFRNIEVYLIDDLTPQPIGVRYGQTYEMSTLEEKRGRSCYGLGTNVYMDILFNEPVFVNDPGYLSYARSLNNDKRVTLANIELPAKYPNDITLRKVRENVLNNNGKTTSQQFSELKLRFKYRNSDGTEKIGHAEAVDRSMYDKQLNESDYNKYIKFKYTVRPEDEFQANDIYEMEIIGGIVTDNSYNMMQDVSRKISFESDSDTSINTIYRSGNFRVETIPPVMLDIDGRIPDGQISQDTVLDLYFKFSEPIYITLSDEAFEKHNIDKYEFNSMSMLTELGYNSILHMNSQYIDQYGDASGIYGSPTASYCGGSGTSMIKYRYIVRENKFDPLEIESTEYIDQDISYGEVYVMDAGGNKAPLLQDKTLKLSDNKWYIADREPPDISALGMKAEDGKDGFYIQVDVTDKGSGVDYDSLMFGFGYADFLHSSIKAKMQPLVSGRKYHSKELSEMFELDVSKSDSFRILVMAKDKMGNNHYSSVFGEGWDAVISIDTSAPTLASCYVNKDKYSGNRGHFNARIVDGDGKSANTGMGSSPDVKYKWVSAGFNPDMEEWISVSRAYHSGLGHYLAEGPGPGYIYKDADLYIKAVDLAGNESIFHMPKALTYDEMANVEDQLAISYYALSKGKVYEAKVERLNRNGIKVPYKGLWYCMTGDAAMPEFAEDIGVWKYKDGNKIDTRYDLEGNPRDLNGYYYLHVYAIDSSNNPVGAATIPDALLFDFNPPQVNVDAERQPDGSWVILANVTDEYTKKEDIKATYTINNTGGGNLPADGKIIIDKDMQNPYASLNINVEDAYQNRRSYNFSYSKDIKTESKPIYSSVSLNLKNYYDGVSYTNEDFVQLSAYTKADEFSYSHDGKSWSNWIPLEKKTYSESYDVSMPYVPLPQKEGELTFYTRYRKYTGEQSDVITSKVVRDVTPPTGVVKYSNYFGSIDVFMATLTRLSDNLCPTEAIEILGGESMVISANEPDYFIIRDVAGNTTEIKALVKMQLPVVVEEERDRDRDNEPSPPSDTNPPVISVSCNGSDEAMLAIETRITVTDDSPISKILYTFSKNSDINEVVGGWKQIENEKIVSLDGVKGIWYLHVKATDAAGNTGKFTSNPYNMVKNYDEPYVVYSGEHEGIMRAFIVSQEPITVTEAVYDLKKGDQPYTFNYTYDDGTEGSVETEYEFNYKTGDDLFKGTVDFGSNYGGTTSDEVVITIKAPTDTGFKREEAKYKGYDFPMIFDNSGEDTLNNDLIKAGNIKILKGRTLKLVDKEWVTDREIYYKDGRPYNDVIEEYGNDLEIYEVKIITDSNGLIQYQVNDPTYTIEVGHILEDNKVNISSLYSERLRAYNTGPLLASASGGYSSNGKGSDYTPPKGQITYTADNWKKGPITANIKLSDNSGGKVTITNNGGSSSYVFNTNGQFVFEFVDEAGNIGRALAEVSTIERTVPKAAISYSTKFSTKDDVKVTLVPEAGVVFKNGDINTVFENGSYSFNAVNNGQWKFIFENEAGIETEVIAIVENIDKIPPKLWLDYISDVYNKTVTAIVRSDEPIFPVEGSTLKHVFKENGQYTLNAEDACGNEASITASVDYIDKLELHQSSIDIKVNYSTQEITNKPVKISVTSDKAFTVLNNNGKAEKEVTKNGIYQFIVKDGLGFIKLMEAEVKNIDTEAPVITTGYPEETTLLVGDILNLMNFTAVDNFDGDITDKVKVEGDINTMQTGTYRATYSVTDSCGNRSVKVLTVKVLGKDDQIVLINGIKHESEPMVLNASQLHISTRGFAGQVNIKWAKGYETVAFFKDGGTKAATDTIPVNDAGWHTLYIYDNERNSRLVHVLINNLGGEQ